MTLPIPSRTTPSASATSALVPASPAGSFATPPKTSGISFDQFLGNRHSSPSASYRLVAYPPCLTRIATTRDTRNEGRVHAGSVTAAIATSKLPHSVLQSSIKAVGIWLCFCNKNIEASFNRLSWTFDVEVDNSTYSTFPLFLDFFMAVNVQGKKVGICGAIVFSSRGPMDTRARHVYLELSIVWDRCCNLRSDEAALWRARV